jgi:hypothetical protein
LILDFPKNLAKFKSVLKNGYSLIIHVFQNERKKVFDKKYSITTLDEEVEYDLQKFIESQCDIQ